MSAPINQVKAPRSMAIFLDTETSGLDPSIHRPLEIAFRIIDPTSGKVLDSYESIIKVSEEDWKNASQGALKVNHFTWEKVQQGKPIEQVAQEITEIFTRNRVNRETAFFICHNPKFDHAFFQLIFSEKTIYKNRWPYHWLDFASMYFANEQKQIVEGRKQNYYMMFGKDAIANVIGCGPEEVPHRAMNGVDHLIKIYSDVIGFQKQTVRGCMI